MKVDTSPFIRLSKPTQNVKELTKKKIEEYKTSLIFWSVKLDGRYFQLHYDGDKNKARFFTSSGNEFHLPWIEEQLNEKEVYGQWIFEGEFLGDSSGLMGDRQNTGDLLTYITDFKKGIVSERKGNRVVLFNTLSSPFKSWKDTWYLEDYLLVDSIWGFETISDTVQIDQGKSLGMLDQIFHSEFDDVYSSDELGHAPKGTEGYVVKKVPFTFTPGKRNRDWFKIKNYEEMKCIITGFVEGEGKYSGMIGALTVRYYLAGGKSVEFTVSSGLTDNQRIINQFGRLQGHEAEVECDYFTDTPVCPRIKRISKNKNPKWSRLKKQLGIED
jgi:hypothetical protein